MKSKAIKQSSQIKSTRRFWWLFLLPVTAAFCIGFVWPFFQGIYLSFCKFKTISSAKFIGLSNYASAFADESFQHSFWYTALTAIVCLVLINVIAFAVAYALTQGIKGSNIFRTIFFAPNLIGGIVLGYIWSMIFDGILQQYGTSVVLETKYGFWGLIILMCWQQIGYMMIIYIAGIQAVPEDMIDGRARLTAQPRRRRSSRWLSLTSCRRSPSARSSRSPTASSSSTRTSRSRMVCHTSSLPMARPSTQPR